MLQRSAYIIVHLCVDFLTQTAIAADVIAHNIKNLRAPQSGNMLFVWNFKYFWHNNVGLYGSPVFRLHFDIFFSFVARRDLCVFEQKQEMELFRNFVCNQNSVAR